MTIKLLKIDSIDRAQRELKAIGVDRVAIHLMEGKSICYGVKVEKCKFFHANVLKQEALALGIDCAVHKGVVTAKTEFTDCLILGDVKRLYKLSEKLRLQNFRFLRELSYMIKEALDNALFKKPAFKFKDKVFEFEDNFMIMGILNITPDSFSDGGEFYSLDSALFRVEEMIEEGADIVDVGGESTRPFSEPVSVDEELNRVIPVVEAIKKRFPAVLVSVDTYKAKVAKEALDRGVEIINDISGLGFDEELGSVLARSDCGVIEMHIKGTPKSMQENPQYDDLIQDINSRFGDILKELEGLGVERERVVLDPGIGFGKNLQHNLEILNNIESFKIWGRPILVGTSRKSFIGGITGVKEPKKRLSGTISSNVLAYIKGARIFRVHDVRANREALAVAQAILNERFSPSSQ